MRAAAASATWTCADASCYAALSTNAPLLFLAGSPQNSTLQLQYAPRGTESCFYSCCSVPVAITAPSAARAPFQSAWSLSNPIVPLGVLAAVPPSTSDAAPQAVVAIAPAPANQHSSPALTQFALAFGIAGQGPGAAAPALPDGASVTVLVETMLAIGGGAGMRMQEFTASTTTPSNPDWAVTLASPPAQQYNLTIAIQNNMTALRTLPFLYCQLNDATQVFTGRVAIIWYANTPELPTGTTAFTLGVQWAAFADSTQSLALTRLSTLPTQLPPATCGVLQSTAGGLTCSTAAVGNTARHNVTGRRQQPSGTAPAPNSNATATQDIALLTTASIIAAVVCAVFIVFVPQFLLKLKGNK